MDSILFVVFLDKINRIYGIFLLRNQFPGLPRHSPVTPGRRRDEIDPVQSAWRRNFYHSRDE
jgi:hypothetical protein